MPCRLDFPMLAAWSRPISLLGGSVAPNARSSLMMQQPSRAQNVTSASQQMGTWDRSYGSDMRRVRWAVLTCLVVGSCASEQQEAAEASVAPLGLQCVEGETEHSPPVSYDTSSPGAATAADALRLTLEGVIASRGGGEIVQLSEFMYAVSEDGRVVHTSTASETRPNEWHLVDISYCE